jgi:hypothetical protein
MLCGSEGQFIPKRSVLLEIPKVGHPRKLNEVHRVPVSTEIEFGADNVDVGESGNRCLSNCIEFEGSAFRASVCPLYH